MRSGLAVLKGLPVLSSQPNLSRFHAPALRERDAGASRLHSHAGAWEREEICFL